MFGQTQVSYRVGSFSIPWNIFIIPLNPLKMVVTTIVSCRLSFKPIHWILIFVLLFHIPTIFPWYSHDIPTIFPRFSHHWLHHIPQMDLQLRSWGSLGFRSRSNYGNPQSLSLLSNYSVLVTWICLRCFYIFTNGKSTTLGIYIGNIFLWSIFVP